MSKQKECPEDKIYNPESKRCVSKTGKIGKKLLSIKQKKIEQPIKRTTQHVKQKEKIKKQKHCPEDKIYNPESKRCVSKTGKIGKKLLSFLNDKPKVNNKDKKLEKSQDNLLKISSWKNEIPKKKGSNPAKIYFDPNGQKYYGKIYKNYERMETENLASKLYMLAGIPSIETFIAKDGKNFVLLQKWINNLRLPKSSDYQNIRKGFITDAWLANWDAPLNDNIMIDGNGNPIRVDVGGTLDYRAKGEIGRAHV